MGQANVVGPTSTEGSFSSCCQQRHVSSKTLLQQNLPNWGISSYRLTCIMAVETVAVVLVTGKGQEHTINIQQLNISPLFVMILLLRAYSINAHHHISSRHQWYPSPPLPSSCTCISTPFFPHFPAPPPPISPDPTPYIHPPGLPLQLSVPHKS